MWATPFIQKFKFVGVWRAFHLALGYTLFVFASLYFAPFLRDYLSQRDLLQKAVSGSYVFASLFIILLFLHKYRIHNPKAYFWFSLLFGLFLLEFFNTKHLVERMHLLEYALFFAVWFRVFRHFFKPILTYGLTLLMACLLGYLDESVQHLLPNRYFDWGDIYLNVYGSLLGFGAVVILMRYRKDSSHR